MQQKHPLGVFIIIAFAFRWHCANERRHFLKYVLYAVKARISSSLYPTCRRFSSIMIGRRMICGFSEMILMAAESDKSSKSTPKVFTKRLRLEISPSTPSSHFSRIRLISSAESGSPMRLRS